MHIYIFILNTRFMDQDFLLLFVSFAEFVSMVGSEAAEAASGQLVTHKNIVKAMEVRTKICCHVPAGGGRRCPLR